jgi:hypothetical protein
MQFDCLQIEKMPSIGHAPSELAVESHLRFAVKMTLPNGTPQHSIQTENSRNWTRAAAPIRNFAQKSPCGGQRKCARRYQRPVSIAARSNEFIRQYNNKFVKFAAVHHRNISSSDSATM